MRAPIALILFHVLVTGSVAAPVGDSDFPWRKWSDAVFAEAERDGKFVLLSLQSWWCPWCHAMNVETYENPEVRAYIDAHFIPIRVDQDSRPDISQRYERWGWPATVLFGPDGTEIVKLRGFYSPKFFMPVLTETVADPSPVDYGHLGGPERQRVRAVRLEDAARERILEFMDEAYDREHGGWGTRTKYVDPATFDLALEWAKLRGGESEQRARESVLGLARLIDKETGAVSQVSTELDWSRPHREFPMFAQEAGLATFSRAYALWGDAASREAANRVYEFLVSTMRDPDGGFYTSMGLERGEPGVDRRRYARENGSAVIALTAYHDGTGNSEALEFAVAAARWVIENRSLAGGGFRHARVDEGGPYLVDQLAMARAFLALHRSTADREWLRRARETADFVAVNFVDGNTGGFLATVRPASDRLGKPVKQKDDNVAAVRLFNTLAWYTGEERYRRIAEEGMGYLVSPAVVDAWYFLPGVLLAEHELATEPPHLTVVGGKDDPEAADLYRAALAYPLGYKRTEWWDKSEGPLPNPDVPYPDVARASAFACTVNFCSLPVTDPDQISDQLDRLLAPPG